MFSGPTNARAMLRRRVVFPAPLLPSTMWNPAVLSGSTRHARRSTDRRFSISTERTCTALPYHGRARTIQGPAGLRRTTRRVAPTAPSRILRMPHEKRRPPPCTLVTARKACAVSRERATVGGAGRAQPVRVLILRSWCLYPTRLRGRGSGHCWIHACTRLFATSPRHESESPTTPGSTSRTSVG